MNLKKYLLLLFPAFFACVAAEATPNCLYFNGNDQYVRIGNDPLKLSRYMTVGFWFNADSFIQGAGMIDNGTEAPGGIFTGYSVCTTAPDGIVIRIGNGIEEVSVALDSIAAGQWQHLAFTLDRFKNDDNIVVFLNGRAVKKPIVCCALNIPPPMIPTVFLSGNTAAACTMSFTGERSNALRIWSYVRSNAGDPQACHREARSGGCAAQRVLSVRSGQREHIDGPQHFGKSRRTRQYGRGCLDTLQCAAPDYGAV
ncbi:MAG: LamG-like jellyroll fold domain-containing protein [Candidatus Marinimicrobia bacterium]|nr:LamG-like jellyroll fold domain-containing protein [Candidatus Neomarinimicrobiota bacterium]